MMPKHGREREIMSDETFDMVLYWIETLVSRETQREVSVQGNGESFLDPKLFERIKMLKEIVPENRPVIMCTNGQHLAENPDLAYELKESGIDRCDISVHKSEWARKAAIALYKAKVPAGLAHGPITASHNWAGQLESDNSIDVLPAVQCLPLMEGRGYVQSNGNVSPCCYDYRHLGMFGSVYDDDLTDKEIRPYELCRTCHQTIPYDILKAHNMTQEAA